MNAELVQKTIDAFWETFVPAWGTIRGNLRGIANERYGISVEQFTVLRHIRKGIKTVSDLAEAKGISRPAISQAVDLLVERGYVSRTQNPQDRRSIGLELTPAGSAMLDDIFAQNRALMAEALGKLSEEELTHVLLSMRAMEKAFIHSGE